MPAKILDGEKLAKKTLHALVSRVEKLKARGVAPCLAAVLVGNSPASELYVGKKTEACRGMGVLSRTVRLGASASEDELLGAISSLNNDDAVHGILVQLPLPKRMDVQRVMECIAPEKDVDGFNPVNLGRLFAGDVKGNFFAPATPLGVMGLLRGAKIKIKSKHAVVVGSSNLVGKPLGIMLLNEFATVTFCHIRTKNLAQHTCMADILVSAVGKPKLITADMVKKGAVVMDVGTTKVGDRVHGDVDFNAVRKKASAITPVPGGVGPMTVASVVANTVKAAELSAGCR
ncbi:MAG: bifunctional 5,10-methylenetetrahydrofolate dehydrogenase/5,10-methenyltetrahydrofolate cyclohydrolase [Candidatus Diapherotrites archaeon]